MARKGKAGGKRTPANPAPVSGPGALSRRTDGGPGQPIRPYPSSGYGSAVALEQQQAAAPMQAGPQGAAGPAPAPTPPPDLFRPTEQPNVNPQAVAAMRDQRPSVIPQDPDMLVRFLNTIAPHPDLERLMDRYR